MESLLDIDFKNLENGLDNQNAGLSASETVTNNHLEFVTNPINTDLLLNQDRESDSQSFRTAVSGIGFDPNDASSPVRPHYRPPRFVPILGDGMQTFQQNLLQPPLYHNWSQPPAYCYNPAYSMPSGLPPYPVPNMSQVNFQTNRFANPLNAFSSAPPAQSLNVGTFPRHPSETIQMATENRAAENNTSSFHSTTRANLCRANTHNTIKLTKFWKDHPKGWFAFIDTKFASLGVVSDEDKYQAVIDVLEADVRQEIRDLLENPPMLDKYGAVRTRLEQVFAESEKSRISRLVSSMPSGDKRPSQILREMQSLVGGSCEAMLLKQLWMNRLVKPVQVGLAALPKTYSLEQYAQVADDVFEALDNSYVHAVQRSSTSELTEPQHSAIDKVLLETLTQVTKQLATLTTELSASRNSRRDSSPTQRGNTRNRSSSRRQFNHPSGMCYHHNKFGSKAFRCSKKDCTFKSTPKESEN